MRKVSKNIIKVFVIFVVIGGMAGVLRVNETLPEVVREYSSFTVKNLSPAKALQVSSGDYKVTVSVENLKYFIRGLYGIGENIKNAVVK